MNRDPRQPSLRYGRSLTPQVDTFRSYVPYSRPSRPARSPRAPSPLHYPTTCQHNYSPSRQKPTFHRRPRTPNAFRPVPTAPRQKTSSFFLSHQSVRSVEDKEPARPPASDYGGLLVRSGLQPAPQDPFGNEVKALEVPFRNPRDDFPMYTHRFACSLVSGIWTLPAAPHSSRVHECTVYFNKEDPKTFDKAKLKVLLSHHAGDDIPFNIRSLQDHGKLTMLSETCKAWDSILIEVNSDQEGGKTFFSSELMDKNEMLLDISQWIVNGMNTVRCIELSGEGSVFILNASSTPSDKRNQSIPSPRNRCISPPQLLYPSDYSSNTTSTDVSQSQGDSDNPLQLSYLPVDATDMPGSSIAFAQRRYY
ncbi:uncharacterized protein ARMOST_02348 [Armillaria ostoyae]|uniref:Uncharacterized protein n=1 Tax=Armillaria ostoyae TaxID=47428 RepID=A0A284QRM1_ARMOS|nr:uncharacterized protein ARMOST_02348 [Armillaria ostoyae]